MITYAAPDDLNGWLDDTAPDDAVRFLRYATVLVSRACQLPIYGDAPVEPAASVLRDAACAQVASWIALGVDPAKAGTDMPGPVSSSTILGATVARNTTAAAALAVEAIKGLCDVASDLLQVAGLLYVDVPQGDEFPFLDTYGLSSPLPYGEFGPRGQAIDATSLDAFGWPFL